MNEITLNKEVIEAIIANTYADADNFKWDDEKKQVTFTYDHHVTSNNIVPYLNQIKRMASEINFLNGAIFQANQTLGTTVTFLDESEGETNE